MNEKEVILISGSEDVTEKAAERKVSVILEYAGGYDSSTKPWNISIALHITSLKYSELLWSLLLKGTKLQSVWVKVSATAITKGIEILKRRMIFVNTKEIKQHGGRHKEY